MRLDDLIEIEDHFIKGLSSKAKVAGHEIGQDEADIFISTDDSQGTFEEAKAILASLGYLDGVRAAFRETDADEYTLLWPPKDAAIPDKRAPTYFPVNTFSLGAQRGGHIPREVAYEEQRMRDAFNLWQGKYTSAVGEFAFVLRVDGPTLRYTELFKIKGAQKAKLKKGWVEVEIGVPQNWWHSDDVEGYKRRLSQALEEGLRSMVDVLQNKSHHVDANALFRDWAKVKENFLGAHEE